MREGLFFAGIFLAEVNVANVDGLVIVSGEVSDAEGFAICGIAVRTTPPIAANPQKSGMVMRRAVDSP